MSAPDLVHVEIYWPRVGLFRPLTIINETADFYGRPVFAVYRPAYSRRGNTINAVRRECDSLAEAWRLAHLPLPPAVVSRWLAQSPKDTQ